ncbi:hypothetical protein TWF694_003149 [Orbilia ellipsospora]|uniref:Uncharacterized protein n=1 Tax=Orbilia ellipsospora TaxID=2528407 RepID=A0AAV9X1X7_9PEZI
MRLWLEEIPDDLPQLYWYMLRTISPDFYFGATKLPKIERAGATSSHSHISLTPEQLGWNEMRELGKRRLQIEDSQFLNKAVKESEITRNRLVSRRSGLLKVRRREFASPHKSRLSFLLSPDIKDALDQEIRPSYSPYSCKLAASLTKVKHTWTFYDIRTSRGQEEIDLIFMLARKAEEELSTTSAYLIDEINKVLSSAFFTGDKYILGEVHPTWQKMDLSWVGIAAHAGFPRPLRWDDTFISFCMQMGLTSYVSNKLNNGESLNQGPQRRPLLDFAIDMKCLYYWTSLYPTSPEIIFNTCRMLLEKGADPNEEFTGYTVWENLIYYATGGFPFRNATLPENFLANQSDVERNANWSYFKLPYHQIWIDLMNLFLDYGADPNAGLVVPEGPTYTIEPVAIIARKFVSSDRVKAMALYRRIISLGGVQSCYTVHRSFESYQQISTYISKVALLEDPTAAKIPTKSLFEEPVLAKPYSEQEGMIPVWSEQPPITTIQCESDSTSVSPTQTKKTQVPWHRLPSRPSNFT